jgi:hypothetical protein
MTEKLGYCCSLNNQHPCHRLAQADNASNFLLLLKYEQRGYGILCRGISLKIFFFWDFSYDFGVCLGPGLLGVAAGILIGGGCDLGLGRAGGWHSISTPQLQNFHIHQITT